MTEGYLAGLARWLATVARCLAVAGRQPAIAARHPSMLDERLIALAGCRINMALFLVE
jgi:hypothetical protein